MIKNQLMNWSYAQRQLNNFIVIQKISKFSRQITQFLFCKLARKKIERNSVTNDLLISKFESHLNYLQHKVCVSKSWNRVGHGLDIVWISCRPPLAPGQHGDGELQIANSHQNGDWIKHDVISLWRLSITSNFDEIVSHWIPLFCYCWFFFALRIPWSTEYIHTFGLLN